MLVKPSSAPRITDRQCNAGKKAAKARERSVTDAAPQARRVAFKQSGSDTERRGNQEAEPHPLGRIHDMT